MGGIVGNMCMIVLLVMLGFSLYGYYRTRLDQVPCSVEHDTDKIFAYFFTNELPSGLAGLLVAALCATTMSVFAGGINAATTCFIIDFVQNHRLMPARHGAVVNTVKLAKILTVCFGLLSIVIAILAQYINESLSLITAVAQAVCCAPVFGVFLLGMLSQRADHVDAGVGLFVCFVFMIYLLAGAAICSDATAGEPCRTNQTHPHMPTVHHRSAMSSMDVLSPVWPYVDTAQRMVVDTLATGNGGVDIVDINHTTTTPSPTAAPSPAGPHPHTLPAVCYGPLLVARLSQWLYAAVGSAVCFFAGMVSMLVRRQSPPVTKIMGLTWWTRRMGVLAEARLGDVHSDYTYDGDESSTPLLNPDGKLIN